MALAGESFGVDFNPTVDRLRIVSDANQNLRVNVDTGALADSNATVPGTQPDRNLAYAVGDPNAGQDPAVTGVAYRNSLPAAPGTTNTEIYDIDANTNDMSEQDPSNDGTLVTEVPLGVNTNRSVGFDIVTRGASPDGDRGFAALRPMNGGETYRLTLLDENGGAVASGASIRTGDEPIECRMNAALLREEATGLEVRMADGDLVLDADLPEQAPDQAATPTGRSGS